MYVSVDVPVMLLQMVHYTCTLPFNKLILTWRFSKTGYLFFYSVLNSIYNLSGPNYLVIVVCGSNCSPWFLHAFALQKSCIGCNMFRIIANIWWVLYKAKNMLFSFNEQDGKIFYENNTINSIDMTTEINK